MNFWGHKKKSKTTREWYFTYLPGRRQWGIRFDFWHAG